MGDFDYLSHILNISFKIWAGQSMKSDFKFVLVCFENRNCFEIHEISCFYKMTLLPLPRSSGRDINRV